MPQKNTDRLRAIRENAAGLRRRAVGDTPPNTDTVSGADESSDHAALTSHFGIAVLDQITAGRAIQHLPLTRIAPALDPQTRQPRLLPHPDELLIDGEPAPHYEALVASLRDLGHSLQERQIQPILVYPGTSDQYPQADFLILVGHRRWLAAHLCAIAELDAIVIDPPSPAERVQLQYAENEDRADFTDMERAWALQQMKQALDDAPWEMVEQRFRLGSTRRHELTRLLAFTVPQQQVIAQLRLRENQVEPLHRAVRAGELTVLHVDAILETIRRKAMATTQSGHRSGIDANAITRMVVQARRAAGVVTTRSPQWIAPFHTRISALIKDLKRLEPRLSELSDAEQTVIIQDLVSLLSAVHTAVDTIHTLREPEAPPDADEDLLSSSSGTGN